MGKIDKIKEILNTLRLLLSILLGFEVLIAGGLISRYDNGKIDSIFWYGIILFSMILAIVFMLFLKIAKKTNEIEDL